MSETAVPIPKKIDLHEFLGYFDFDYEVIPYDETYQYETKIRKEKLANGEFTEQEIYEPMFSFIDLQGVYLGDIDEERYLFRDNLVKKIINRLDIYIYDYIFEQFENELLDKDIDPGYMTFKEIYLTAKESGITDVSYSLAEYIIHPESIQVDELEKNKIENLITVAEKKQEHNDIGAVRKELSNSEVDFHY